MRVTMEALHAQGMNASGLMIPNLGHGYEFSPDLLPVMVNYLNALLMLVQDTTQHQGFIFDTLHGLAPYQPDPHFSGQFNTEFNYQKEADQVTVKNSLTRSCPGHNV